MVERPDSNRPIVGGAPASVLCESTVLDASTARHELVDDLISQATRVKHRDYARLKALSEEAFELACQQDSDGRQHCQGMAAALAMLAHVSCVKGESEAALQQVSQAFALIDSGDQTALRGDLFLTTGAARYQAGDFVDSLGALMTAQHIAEKTGDRRLAAFVMDRMATVYRATRRPSLALDMQQRALGIHRELHDDTGEALVLNHMAFTYLDLNQFKEALDSALAALRWAESEESLYLLMKALETIAEIYRSTGDLEMAAEYSERGLVLASEHRSEPDRGDALFTIARIELQRERYDEALEAAQESLNIAQSLGRGVEEFTCHELLSRIQERRGQLASALAHARCHHTLERRRMNEETASRLASLQVEHELDAARKDAEIHRLTSLALQREVEQGRVAQTRLETQASLDPLTGLFNRGHISTLAENLEGELGKGHHVSVILTDIDHFKEINDTHGHFAGDRALVAIARLLRDNGRATDVSIRYGGDEFMVLLVGNGPEETAAIAERFRRTVASTPVEHAGTSLSITASMGVASADIEEFEGLVALIGRADRALYAAKQAGRNCVVVDTP